MIRVDIDKVTDIIREVAAERILPRFRNLKQGDITFKIGDDPVTIADKEAESDLTTRFLDLLPGSKVVGEEAFAANQGIFEAFSGESPVWIIDPVDGTRNFTAGSCEFGVIVSLVKQNQIFAGWIYDPTSNEVVTAEKGAGAWYKGKKLGVSTPKSLETARMHLGDRIIRAHAKHYKINELPELFHPISSCAHTYPQLAIDEAHFGKNNPQGHFYASFHSTPWDDAAGILIHHEAGGYSARWSGDAFDPAIMHQGIMLAPNRDSWNEFKNWCNEFCNLPTE